MIILLLEAGWKSFVLLAIAGSAVLCLRRASAATRHMIWLMGMVGLLFLPLFCTLPHWRVLPQWLDGATPEEILKSVITVPHVSMMAADPSASLSTFRARSEISEDLSSRSVNQNWPRSPAFTMPAPTDIAKCASVSWFLGACVVIVMRLCGVWSLARLERRSKPVTDSELPGVVRELSGASVASSVVFLKTSLRRIPMTWGLFRPKVLLPEEAWKWPREKLRGVLLHELAHVKRRDYLSNLLAQFICGIYWFNPLAWLAARGMLAERERACDDIVLTHGIKPDSYAEHLLEMAAGIPAQGLESRAAIPMAPRSSFEGRLIAILDTNRSRASAQPRALVAAAILMLGCFAALGLVSTRTDQAGPQSTGGVLARALAFSPIIERALPSQTTGDSTPYLHFQNGEIIFAPPDPQPPSRPVTNEWMTRDVTIGTNAEGLELRGRQCAFMRIDTTRWDRIPPETVVKELSAANLPDHVPLPDTLEKAAVYLFKTRESTLGVLEIATGLSGKGGSLNVRYKLIQPLAHPAQDSRRLPGPLLNIDFCFGNETSEAGPAAVGQRPDDFWNAFNCEGFYSVPRAGGTQEALKLADGTVTGVSMTVSNAPADFANGSDDIMYHGFMYSDEGEPVTVTVRGLSEGAYDFYIYTHDGNDQIESSGLLYPKAGPAHSFDWPVSNPIIWQEGRQFVAIRGVRVVPGQPVTINALPGRHGIAPLSGMQIAKVN